MDKLLGSKKTRNKILMFVLGQLENITIIVFMFGHFLKNIRSLQISAERKRHNVIINKRTREDLTLAKKSTNPKKELV